MTISSISSLPAVVLDLCLVLRVRNRLDPHVQDGHGERDRELEHEDRGTQLAHVEVLEVQEEHVLTLSLVSFFLFLGLRTDLLRVFLEVELEDVVDVRLLADCHIPLLLDESVLRVAAEHLAG